MEASDLAVVARVKAGVHDVFRHLVEGHSRSVFRLAYRLTGQEQDAEDVVQETSLRAFREIRRVEARSSFATWLYRITVNCSHDLLRQRPSAGSRPSLDDPDLDVAAGLADTSAAADPVREFASRRIDERVHAAMGTQYVRLICEHSGRIGEQPGFTLTRSTLPGPLGRLFVLPHHIGYHIEHHWFPSVPWYRPPDLHAALRADPAFAAANVQRSVLASLHQCVG